VARLKRAAAIPPAKVIGAIESPDAPSIISGASAAGGVRSCITPPSEKNDVRSKPPLLAPDREAPGPTHARRRSSGFAPIWSTSTPNLTCGACRQEVGDEDVGALHQPVQDLPPFW